MDEATLRYYEKHAEELASVYEGTPNPLTRRLEGVFPPGARVLDVGAGTGRDVAHLVREGYEAYGLEPTEAFRGIGRIRHPEVAARIVAGALPGDLPSAEVLGGRFDGILCTAVLQHVPRARLIEAVLVFKDLLKAGGRILVSVPAARPDLDSDDRAPDGRLFTRLHPAELRLLFERAGFTLVDVREDPDPLGRAGHAWAVLLLRLESTDRATPLDRIESVLSQDKKVATYKLALLRALAEVAVSQPHLARREPDGRVSLPMEALAAKWILYYWPLLASERFLPQLEGDARLGAHKLRFSTELLRLVDRYRRSGGLAQFRVDLASDTLPADEKRLYGTLLQKTLVAIREGPVVHAGAVSEAGPLFQSRNRRLLVDPGLWRDLSILGPWIADAVILRWAEETSRISARSVSPSEVVDPLLDTGDLDRDQKIAQRIYLALPSLQCIWTGKRLDPSTLAIDHLVPFSLWRNNDLWNLLPSDRKVNLRKGDRLPSRALLRSRREPILGHWEASRRAHPRRFARESANWAGHPDIKPARLFEAVCEAIEFTALQRGARRWEP